MVLIFSKYIIIQKVTVPAVKSCNRKGECFPKRHRRQTFFEGESSSRNRRYDFLKINFSFGFESDLSVDHVCSLRNFDRTDYINVGDWCIWMLETECRSGRPLSTCNPRWCRSILKGLYLQSSKLRSLKIEFRVALLNKIVDFFSNMKNLCSCLFLFLCSWIRQCLDTLNSTFVCFKHFCFFHKPKTQKTQKMVSTQQICRF